MLCHSHGTSLRFSPRREVHCAFGASARPLGEKICLAQYELGVHLFSYQVQLIVAAPPCSENRTLFSDMGHVIWTETRSMSIPGRPR